MGLLMGIRGVWTLAHRVSVPACALPTAPVALNLNPTEGNAEGTLTKTAISEQCRQCLATCTSETLMSPQAGWGVGFRV